MHKVNGKVGITSKDEHTAFERIVPSNVVLSKEPTIVGKCCRDVRPAPVNELGFLQLAYLLFGNLLNFCFIH